jgi:hypothetical protein
VNQRVLKVKDLMSEKTNSFVDGIVAARDKQPYLRLFADGVQVGQVTMAQARNIAMDILQMCARTEADAMIHQFFEKQEYPGGAANALMIEFRDFRLALDNEAVERSVSDPDALGKVQ